MFGTCPRNESRNVPFHGDGRSAPTAAGILMIDKHSSIPALESCRTGGTENGLRQIDARTLAELLLENSQLRQELRRVRMSALHLDGGVDMEDQAASLAHEIKQPIASAALDAGACLRWLQHVPPDLGRARAAATRMISDARRAADVVDCVLSLYRRGAFKREPVDVNDMIRGIVPQLRDLAGRSRVSVHTDLDPQLPRVSADFVQLQQVLINLMINGIEAMHDTGGELTVTSGTAEDGQILVAVSDLGIGLPAGRIDHVFEAFFTTKPEGNGLGLSISRTIIESHGGRLWASTNAEKGATFRFTLPAD